MSDGNTLDDVLQVRIDGDIKRALIKRARSLGISVSVLARWAFEWATTASLVELRPSPPAET